jgi:hypothetical protein
MEITGFDFLYNIKQYQTQIHIIVIIDNNSSYTHASHSLHHTHCNTRASHS